ncbi:rod-determining factor RdfA [Natrialbaceae archaeon A-CW1-1]
MSCKVCDQIEQYNINADPGAEYEKKNGSKSSVGVRKITTQFNAQMLQEIHASANSFYSLSVLESDYKSLDSEEGSEEKQRAEERLRNIGVNPDLFARDPERDNYAGEFVSYGSMYVHLTLCCGVDTSKKSKPLPQEKAIQRSDKLAHRTRIVSEETLDQLTRQQDIRTNVDRVDVEVGVTCAGCDRRWDFSELVRAGGCPKCCSEDGANA